jgi:predicted CXXCH cytochrome family protein
MQMATPDTVLGDFSGAAFGPPGNRTLFSTAGNRFTIRTKGTDDRVADFEVVYSFGVEPLQQYLIAAPGGRYQAFGVAWDTRPKAQGGQRWFDLYPQALAPSDPLHWTAPAQNWNFMCAECHSTDLQKNYSQAGDRYDTRWAEINVACEACHGPGSRHVAWARAGERPGGTDDPVKGLLVSLDDRGTWMRGATARTAGRDAPPGGRPEVETCARCHSRRAPLWPEYRHGRPIGETHRVSLLDEGLYHPDGQLIGEVYEYGSFLQSRMYAAGVTCSNCHDPHSGELRVQGNGLCGQCHSPEAYGVKAHHFHEPAGEAGQCVTCHMPERTYMVLDGRRDHGFRIPRPDESVAYGTPNACTGCHEGKPAAWAAEAIVRWYGPAARRRASFTGALAAGRARRPDGQTALITVARNPALPPVARATAVALLAAYPGAATDAAVEAAAADPDALVRRASASLLPALEPSVRARLGLVLLRDPVRSVRMESVLPMAAAAGGLSGRDGVQAFERAASEFRTAQLLNADRAEAHLNLGTLEAQLGRPGAAESAFRTAIRVGPAFSPAYIALADLQRAASREGEAEGTLREGLRHQPAAADLRHALGLALVRQGRLKEALGELARAVALEPGEARYAYVHGVALHDAGEPARARRVLAEAAARHPADRPILEALVSYSIQAGDRAGARQWAERLSALAPSDGRAAALLQSLRDPPAR